MAGEVAFIELGVTDTVMARTFYAALFGWSFAPGPAEGGVMVSGVGVPAGLRGRDRGASPDVFFSVDDMTAALEKVRELSGSVESLDIGGDESAESRFGRLVLCRDDQESKFGLREPAA